MKSITAKSFENRPQTKMAFQERSLSAMSSRIIVLSMLVSGLALGPGCATMTKEKGPQKKDSPWSSLQFWKKGYQQPQKMAVLWSHDVLTVAGKPPTRGFGGRIYFYNERSQAIPVAGELVVHGFDETAKKRTGAPENQADKRFRFTEEQFTSHFSESDLGASYSIWIPWDNADGVQKEITLLPTFKSSKGELVQGDPAKVVLPGRGKPEDMFKTPVQTVSYQESTMNTVEGQLPQLGPKKSEEDAGGMRTTTIQLGSSFARNARQSKGGPTVTTSNTPAAASALAATSPAAASALDQARARIIEDAFRQAPPPPQQPAPTYSAWNPSTVQMSGATAVNANNLMPQATWPQQVGKPVAQTAPVQGGAPTGGSGGTQPQGSAPSDEGYSLPPGIQLSPRGNAWPGAR